MEKENIKQSVQNKLSDNLINLFDNVIENRKKHFKTNDRPSIDDVKNIVNSVSNKNAVISGGINLIPGPWGLLAAIPEITLVIRNQIVMIYDIGIAYGKEEILNKELLASIFLMAMGNSGIGLLVMQGNKFLVKRTSLRFFQKIIEILAGKITQRLIKSVIVKWLPVVGAGALALWSRFSTQKIGKKAIEILSKDIEIDNNTYSDEETDFSEIIVNEDKDEISFDELKVHTLIKLMKIDRKIHEKEIEYITSLIDSSNFSIEKKQELKDYLYNEDKIEIDYSVFKNKPDESIGLIIDLIALAKRDGEFHPAEKLYIYQIASQIGFDKNEIDELLKTQ